MRLRHFGMLLALACGTLGHAAFGGEIVAQNRTQGGKEYESLQAAIDEANSGDAIILKADVKEFPLSVVGKGIDLHLNAHSLTSIVKIDNAAKLRFFHDGGTTNSFFCGTFEVVSGTLDIDNVTCYSYGSTNPVIRTTGPAEKRVAIRGGAIRAFSENDTLFVLDGEGDVVLSDGCDVGSDYWFERTIRDEKITERTEDGKTVVETNVETHVTKEYYKSSKEPIILSRGNLTLDGAKVTAGDVAITIGTELNDGSIGAPSGVATLTMTNGAEITSSSDGVVAIPGDSEANKVEIVVDGSTVDARFGGFRLKPSTGADTFGLLSFDHDCRVTTQTETLGYAIEDESAGDWDVVIKGGTFYRMKKQVDAEKTVEEAWIPSGYVAKWEPEAQEDNVKLMVSGGIAFKVIFDDNDGVNVCKTNSYTIMAGETVPITNVLPSVGNVLTNGVFAGWFPSRDDASDLRNPQTTVTSTVSDEYVPLFAGWKTARVRFCDEEASPAVTNLLNLVEDLSAEEKAKIAVNASTLDISAITPDRFGWPTPAGKEFFGWWTAPGGKGSRVKSLYLPVETTLYAAWIKTDAVARLDDGTTYPTLQAAIDAVTNASQRVYLVRDLETSVVVTNEAAVYLDLGDYALTLLVPLVVKDADLCLLNGSLDGQISIGDAGHVEIDGGAYTSKTDSVISATGTNYSFWAENASFTCLADDSTISALFFGGSAERCSATLTNCTVTCASGSGLTLSGGSLDVAATKVEAGAEGVWVFLDENKDQIVTCTIANSSIKAQTGIVADPSALRVSGTTIDASVRALQLAHVGETEYVGEAKLSGKNVFAGKGGVYDFAIGFGSQEATNDWEIVISGGTYSQQTKSRTVESWIDPNCDCVWETATRFTVTNREYAIRYDLEAKLPEKAKKAVAAGEATIENKNPSSYPIRDSLAFVDATCTGSAGANCAFDHWAFKDASLGTDAVVAITNGCVVVRRGGKPVQTTVTGDLDLVAVWGNWRGSDVAIADGVKYATLAEAFAAAGTNTVKLIADVVDEPTIDISAGAAFLDLAGHNIGGAKGDVTISVKNSSQQVGLSIFDTGTNGVVTGTIKVGNNAVVKLDGGSYFCDRGEVLTAAGTNYLIYAVNARFERGSVLGNVISLTSSDSSGAAQFTGSTITCKPMLLDVASVGCGIAMCGGTLELEGSAVSAPRCGINLSGVGGRENICVVSEGSSITAYTGISSDYAYIDVSDSTITATETKLLTKLFLKEPAAFDLRESGSVYPELYLGGANVIEGGIVSDGGVAGGLFKFESDPFWAEGILISGGTYAHQADREIVESWMDEGCKAEWLDETTFTVTGGSGEDDRYVAFASGVVVKEVDYDDPEFEDYVEVDLYDEEMMAQYGVTVTDEAILEGLGFSTNDVSIVLPSGIAWRGHTLKGWAVYEPDDLTDPEKAVVAQFAPGAVAVKDFVYQSGEMAGEPIDLVYLHAVWDTGDDPVQGGIASFDELYDEDDMPPLTGGDTYTGAIMDGDKVIGTVTVRCGLPRADGSVDVTATVTIAGEGTHTYTGTGTYFGDTIDVDLEKGEHSLSLSLGAKALSGSYDAYDVQGGVNRFKGNEEDKDEAEIALAPWLGKWMFVFATLDARTEYAGEDENENDGAAHAYGYSYVLMDIKRKGHVTLSGKLANGKEVSATTTAIVGDYGICVPAVCSIYSGYDWLRLGSSKVTEYLIMDALESDLKKAYMRVSNRGGFGFTAWFSCTTNDIEYVNVNNVSDWDSSHSKAMPFVVDGSDLVMTNCQRVAEIQVPRELAFCVDLETADGWFTNSEKLGDIAPDWIPMNPTNSYGEGYSQFVDVTAVTDGSNTTYKMKAQRKKAKMHLVDGTVIPKKGGTNYSGLKLKYNTKKGIFSGSFKVYSVKEDEETGDSKLKKTKIIVSGAMANGRGYGFGHKKNVGTQPVTLDNVNGTDAPIPEKKADPEPVKPDPEPEEPEEDDEDYDDEGVPLY